MNQSKNYVMKELKCNIILFIKNIIERKNHIILIEKLWTKFFIHLNFNINKILSSSCNYLLRLCHRFVWVKSFDLFLAGVFISSILESLLKSLVDTSSKKGLT